MTESSELVVVCDESGNDGENLLQGSNPVFAHASLALSEGEAAEIMADIRSRTGSKSVELKSDIIVRRQHLNTARWLLEHPLLAEATSLHLTHKRYFLVAKLFDATAEEAANVAGIDMYADGSALCGANILHFLAPSAFSGQWERLLLAFQRFLRSETSSNARTNLQLLDAAFQRVLAVDSSMHQFVEMVYAGIAHLQSLSELQLGEGTDHRLRTLDPIVSAAGAAVSFWAEKTGRPISIVHDAAAEMMPQRTVAMRKYLARPYIVAPSQAGRAVELRGLDLVDSQGDERVQVADLMAGLARVVAETAARGEEHPLWDCVTPFLNKYSLWPDVRLMDPEYAKAHVAGV